MKAVFCALLTVHFALAIRTKIRISGFRRMSDNGHVRISFIILAQIALFISLHVYYYCHYHYNFVLEGGG